MIEGKTLVIEGKTLVTEGKTLVTEGKTLVTNVVGLDDRTYGNVLDKM